MFSASQRQAVSMYLEPPVVLGHCVCKIDLLPLAHKLLKFRVVLHPNVIPNEIPVNAVSPSLLLVQQEVGGCNSQKAEKREGSVFQKKEENTYYGNTQRNFTGIQDFNT